MKNQRVVSQWQKLVSTPSKILPPPLSQAPLLSTYNPDPISPTGNLRMNHVEHLFQHLILQDLRRQYNLNQDDNDPSNDP
jgi:hypothetical protein